MLAYFPWHSAQKWSPYQRNTYSKNTVNGIYLESILLDLSIDMLISLSTVVPTIKPFLTVISLYLWKYFSQLTNMRIISLRKTWMIFWVQFILTNVGIPRRIKEHNLCFYCSKRSSFRQKFIIWLLRSRLGNRLSLTSVKSVLSNWFIDPWNLRGVKMTPSQFFFWITQEKKKYIFQRHFSYSYNMT